MNDPTPFNIFGSYDTSKKQRTPSWTDRIMWRESQISGTPRVTPCSYWSSHSETSSDHRPVGASFQLQLSLAPVPTAGEHIVSQTPALLPLVPILITNPGMGQMAHSAADAVSSNVSWAVGAVSGAFSSNVKRLSTGLSEVFLPGSTAGTTIAAFTCKPEGNILTDGRPGALSVMEAGVQFASIGSKQPLIPYDKMKQITVASDWRNGIFIHIADAAPVKFSDFNLLGLGKFSGNQRRHAVRMMQEQAAKLGVQLAVDAKLLQ
jgi:hypothetical protein